MKSRKHIISRQVTQKADEKTNSCETNNKIDVSEKV